MFSSNMFEEDQERLEERKLNAKRVLEQSQKTLTCDVISVGMIKNYKLRCEEEVKVMNHYPTEISDYIRLLERVVEPTIKGLADNVNVVAYIKGITDEIVIELPPIMTEPVQNAHRDIVSSASNSHLPFMETAYTSSTDEQKYVSIDEFKALAQRVELLESKISPEPIPRYTSEVYHGRDNKYEFTKDKNEDHLRKYIENMSSSNFLDLSD